MSDEIDETKPTTAELTEDAKAAVTDGEEFETLTKGEIAWLKNWIQKSKQNPEAITDETTIRKIEALTVASLPIEEPEQSEEAEEQSQPAKKLTRRERRAKRVRRLKL